MDVCRVGIQVVSQACQRFPRETRRAGGRVTARNSRALNRTANHIAETPALCSGGRSGFLLLDLLNARSWKTLDPPARLVFDHVTLNPGLVDENHIAVVQDN